MIPGTEPRPGWSGRLRRPVVGSPDALFYKDWLHVNVVDHERGAVGLVNASVHGDPRDVRAVAVGAALLHLPGPGWLGAVVGALRDVDAR